MNAGIDADSRPVALAFRALQLGDLLVAVPALKALRASMPDHRLLLATSAWLAPVVDLVDAVDGLIPTGALGEPLPVEPGSVDIAVNLHGGGPESAAVVDALGARLVVRHALRPGEPGPAWMEELHERARWVRLTAAFGMPGDPDDVSVARPEVASPAPGSAVLHVGAAFPSRAWQVDRFAAVAAALEAAGRRVVFSGSAAERPRALEVAALARLPESRVLAGETSLLGFVALIAEASLVVTADTGAGHLASAYGVPSVVLFGPVPPERWGPPPGPHVALTHAEVRDGDAFADRPDPALAAVTVDEVLAAVARL
ncbi:glycosyltransferase family 9 protein [Amnibacterium kyonggiense]|uniref:ADP-heptose:LPS heptosyltransferase n=1 Tax=Amnibacterium kyonggiense TaxID=595671 RepID=A0A4V3EAE2_9MICO|nr:glycosyltransferase family 9 protein [Amnibacterium kyonggiense]TDS76038.1 ADP-heptose:LPS heptosyltransferase [Amnibacterium kyonggiense]